MFCMNCGAKLPDGAKFCMNCGFQITHVSSMDTASFESPKNKEYSRNPENL